MPKDKFSSRMIFYKCAIFFFFFFMNTLLFHWKMAKFATNYRSLNFSIEADSFKCTIFFYKYAVISPIYGEIWINCQNRNFFWDWFFKCAIFLHYMLLFRPKTGKNRNKALKSGINRKWWKLSCLYLLNFVKSSFF